MTDSEPAAFLSRIASSIKAKQAEIIKLDTGLVENDIAARRIEAAVGWEFAQQVDAIEAALMASRQKLNVEQWCKRVIGVDISTMRRRKRLYRFWTDYEGKRREIGQCGQSGLLFALSLISDTKTQTERSGKAMPVRFQTGTEEPDTVSFERLSQTAILSMAML